MDNKLVQNLRDEIQVAASVPDSDTKSAKTSIYQDQFDAATLQNFLENQQARKKYSHRIFLITTGWLISVIAILILVGCKQLVLSDSIIIALLGTTTVNVLGFFLIVIQYLFNKEKST